MTPLVIALNVVSAIAVSAAVLGLLAWTIVTEARSRSAAAARRHIRLVESPRLDSVDVTEHKAAA